MWDYQADLRGDPRIYVRRLLLRQIRSGRRMNQIWASDLCLGFRGVGAIEEGITRRSTNGTLLLWVSSESQEKRKCGAEDFAGALNSPFDP
ncbi:hypothetical protein PROFUN_04502 [Planoprotostelium fungivorum]|uniref:Uncharacterized protein n=1 Tax=Planoprotostelium fungivorum TaxID=1890364 RepID=A0A2P6NBF3_9EUKA|nr:hypothetical protein PROFUN_04502 [Planoprotostelium fungivorum]